MNIYNDQNLLEEDVNNIYMTPCIVVGIGGIGTHLLQSLYRNGFGRNAYIKIIDPDTVSESNLNRQILYGQIDVGHHKASIAKLELNSKINGNIVFQVGTFEEVKDSIITKDKPFVFDCTDNVASKEEIFKFCETNKLKLFSTGMGIYMGWIAYHHDNYHWDLFNRHAREKKATDTTFSSCAGIMGNLMAQLATLVALGKPMEYNFVTVNMQNLCIQKLTINQGGKM